MIETLVEARTPRRFPKVKLVDPVASGYLHIAAEVDRRPPVLPNSRRKRRLLARCKELCRRLSADPRVREAVVFDAILIPPGRGRFLAERPGLVHPARFDVAILVETEDAAAIAEVRASAPFRELEGVVRAASRYTHVIAARNVRRIDAVDHSRQGIFLFNYFFADDTEQNLAVWEYTAGWFQHETGLDNSTVLRPAEGESSQYNIINHCRWDRLADVVPSLILKPSFRSYVLAHFYANRVAAMPVLYRIARGGPR